MQLFFNNTSAGYYHHYYDKRLSYYFGVSAMNQLNCAVTGSSGYVGKHIINTLRQRGHTTYELGRLQEGAQLENFFLKFNLNSAEMPDLQNIDVLIHCAYDFSADTIISSKKINIDGSLRLLQHAKKSGVTRIILISSLSAYEKTKSVYGKTKLLLEKKACALGVIIIRPGLIFGGKTHGIVGSMQAFIKKFPVVPLIGNGKQEFYPCYIVDLCHLISHLAITDEVYKKPIIAASKKAVTFRDLIKILAQINHKKVRLIPIPFSLIWLGLKFLEILHINMGLRSDSLIGAQFYDKNLNFSNFDTLEKINFSTINPTLFESHTH